MNEIELNEPSSLPTFLPPFLPLLYGSGKLARHLSHYFTLLQIPHMKWEQPREGGPKLLELLNQATSVLILTSDQAIAEVHARLKQSHPRLSYFHASAALSIPEIISFHPLQSFGPDLYTQAEYESFAFTIFNEEWLFAGAQGAELRARLPNAVMELPIGKKALYHAYCVMIANLPQILWSAVFGEIQKDGDLIAAPFLPLLARSAENFLELGPASLTGPLVRHDQLTLEKHQTALQGSLLASVYLEFITLYQRYQESRTR